MAKYISLVFNEDLHRDDLPSFKEVRGCIGLSAYRNTLNMYFDRIDRTTLRSLAAALQRQLVCTGLGLELSGDTIDSTASVQEIYGSLREELAI